MNYKYTLLITSVLLLFLIIAISFYIDSQYSVPESLISKWSSTQLVTVRMKKNNGDFSFIKSTVDVQIIINKNGEVEEFFGDAKLDSCSVTNNRGWFGKLLNLNTNYIIIGNLNGKIFDRDLLIHKEISCPFNMQGSQLKGTAFQRQGMSTFPMVNFQLSKN